MEHDRELQTSALLHAGKSVATQHILIVGGGASGALMALHLLRAGAAGQGIRITMIEKTALLGCGLAYATRDPNHLLNTRVHNMSAYADDPHHFLNWLHGDGHRPDTAADCFVGRQVYGEYLNGLIGNALAAGDQLTSVRGECIKLGETPTGIVATLEDGQMIEADKAILATGHAVPMIPHDGLTPAWDFSPPDSVDDQIVIIGTGLSMVDHVVTLLKRGHSGTITCLSRRALLPQVHAPTRPLPVSLGDIPLGQSVSTILHWLRALAQRAEAEGGTWRDAVDGIRPYVSSIWQHWSDPERRRFLRHVASWWEVHRHRMPPQSAELIEAAIDRGQLRILRARFLGSSTAENQITVRIQTAAGHEEHAVHRVIDCRGIRRDPMTDSAPVIRALLQTGAARLDRMKLGLDTTADARLIDANGRVSDRIHAIGPCARGALWEITAIPDIREQCAHIAGRLIDG